MKKFVTENTIGGHSFTLREPRRDIILIGTGFVLCAIWVVISIVIGVADIDVDYTLIGVMLGFSIFSWIGLFVTGLLFLRLLGHVITFDEHGITETHRFLSFFEPTVSLSWDQIADWGVQSGVSVERYENTVNYTLYFSAKRLLHDPRGTDFGENPTWRSSDEFDFQAVWASGLIDFCTLMIGRAPDHNDISDVLESLPPYIPYPEESEREREDREA